MALAAALVVPEVEVVTTAALEMVPNAEGKTTVGMV